jgi:hypothetical protein
VVKIVVCGIGRRQPAWGALIRGRESVMYGPTETNSNFMSDKRYSLAKFRKKVRCPAKRLEKPLDLPELAAASGSR